MRRHAATHASWIPQALHGDADASPGLVSVSRARVELGPTIAAEFELILDSSTSCVARVELPDGAGAMLTTLSWGRGARIRDFVEAVSASYLKLVVASRRFDGAGSRDLRLVIPLAYLRNSLDSRARRNVTRRLAAVV